MKPLLRSYSPQILLLLAALSGAWLFGGFLTFMASYAGAIQYKVQTGKWGWAEGMLVSMDAGRVFVASAIQAFVVFIAIRDSQRNPALYPKWFFVLFTAFCSPLGVGFYISLFAFGILPS